MHLPAVLRELGCVPSAVLSDAGFDEGYFADPDLPIPYVGGTRLLAHCVAASGCEHLCLLIGERVGPEALGLPGLLLMSATNVGAALGDLIRHMDLHDRGGVVTL